MSSILSFRAIECQCHEPKKHIHVFNVTSLFYFHTDCEEFFVGILVFAIIIFALLIILAYSVYQIHLLKSFKEKPEKKKGKKRNDSDDICENSDYEKYERVENEQAIYTSLKRSEERDDYDHHVYAHLTDIRKDFVDQWESSV